MQPSRWRAIRMAASAWRTVASTVIVAAFACCHAASAAPTHPLDPLDAGELVAVRDILAQSGRFSTTTNFAWIGLAEPPKKIVEEFRGGIDFPRQAYVAAIDYDKGRSFRVIIDLRSGRIASMDDLGVLHPGLTDADLDIAAAIVDADPRIKAALIRRGLDIPDRVTESVRVQYQPVGADRTLDQEKNRLLRVLFTSDQNANSNTSPYIDGLMAVVDLYAKTVIQFDDSPGAASVPVPHDVLDPKLRDAVAAARAVVPTQPDGRNFAVEGNVVTWRNWRLRFGFNLREGLVLYQVGFNDRGRLRPILYRASVSEVLTAYGDPGRILVLDADLRRRSLGPRIPVGAGAARPRGAGQRHDPGRGGARSDQGAVQPAVRRPHLSLRARCRQPHVLPGGRQDRSRPRHRARDRLARVAWKLHVRLQLGVQGGRILRLRGGAVGHHPEQVRRRQGLRDLRGGRAETGKRRRKPELRVRAATTSSAASFIPTWSA